MKCFCDIFSEQNLINDGTEFVKNSKKALETAKKWQNKINVFKAPQCLSLYWAEWLYQNRERVIRQVGRRCCNRQLEARDSLRIRQSETSSTDAEDVISKTRKVRLAEDRRSRLVRG